MAIVCQAAFIAAVDPTGGLLSEAALLAAMSTAAHLGIEMPSQRTSEYAADALSLRLAASACNWPERKARGLATSHHPQGGPGRHGWRLPLRPSDHPGAP